MLARKHEMEAAARKHAILAHHEVEKALRQLSGYPGRPPALMQAERDLLDVRRLLGRVDEALKPKSRSS